MKIDVYKPKGKVLCSAYMYDGVVTDGNENDFEYPEVRLKSVLTCYNTQLSGLIRNKRREYISSNKLIHALDEEKSSQRSFEGIFNGMFVMKDFHHKMSSLIVQSSGKLSIGYS